jgi:hypothetical protein
VVQFRYRDGKYSSELLYQMVQLFLILMVRAKNNLPVTIWAKRNQIADIIAAPLTHGNQMMNFQVWKTVRTFEGGFSTAEFAMLICSQDNLAPDLRKILHVSTHF